MNDGWVKIYRSIKENPMWQDKPFSKGQAWIDLILRANHEPRDLLVGNKIVTIERGQTYTSVLKLSKEWGWSREKTKNFLQLLCNTSMATTDSTTIGTTITLMKYDDYQCIATTDHTTVLPTESQRKDNEKTTKRHKQELKELKELKEEIEVSNDTSPQTAKEIVSLFNKICVSFPKVKSISENRKKAINARLKTYSFEQFRELFEKAEASDFLKGKNQRNWSANFDWLICDSNMAKALDGNYDNKKKGSFDGDDFFKAAVQKSSNIFAEMMEEQHEQR